MPIYCFGCDRCREGFEVFRPIAEAPLAAPCPTCGATAARDLAAEMAQVRPDIKGFASEAMGICPGDPGLPGESYTPDGALRVKSRRHKRELLDKLGYEEKK